MNLTSEILSLGDSLYQNIMNTGDENNFTGLLLATASFLLWEYIKSHRQLEKFEEAYWGERRGRVPKLK